MLRTAEHNPFRISQLDLLEWNDDLISVRAAYQLWENAGFRGQLVGHHGSGKTTLARKLGRMAEQQGHRVVNLFCNLDNRRESVRHWADEFAQVDEMTLVIADGLGHMPFWLRRKWLRRHDKVLGLLHRPVNRLPLLCRMQSNADLLRNLVQQLNGEEGLRLVEQAGGAEVLLQRHQNNLRDCFQELYHHWREA